MAPPQVLADTGGPSLGRSCAEYLTSHRAQLIAAIASGQRGSDLARRFARMFDGLFSTLFCAAEAKLREQGSLVERRVSVVAVGGYGRSLVAPHSDVDVLFLCEQPDDPRVVELAEAMLYPLWDSGVDVGHAVRGYQDTLALSRTDIRTSTTLLDMRHVAGDRSLVEELSEEGKQLVSKEELATFLEALTDDTVSRHDRFGGTLYLREPELKLGRGGLRDLDVLTWMGRASWNVRDLDGLHAAGGLTESELIDLRAATEHLWTVRNHLHVAARRRQDRLTFEDQEMVADRLGYRDEVRLGVERFMQAHYRHARVIARVVDLMAERARRSMRPAPTTIRDLGRGLRVHDAHIVVDEATMVAEPITALRLYEEVYEEQLPPDPGARDVLAALTCDRDWCQRLRRDPEVGALFRSLIVDASLAPLRSGSFLQELHELGVLLALIPEFEPIMGRVVHDSYHAYTSDVESIKAVDQLRALSRGDLAGDYHTATRAAAEMPRPTPLHVALLVRCIGAGHPDDPARHAAALAAPIGERLGLSANDVRHVQWLVQSQNAFYNWALRRDITDPETIAEVATEVQTLYRLRDLYLLTFCDVSTANPNAMTAWNARMLSDLFKSVTQHIEGGDRAVDQIERLDDEVLRGVEDAETRRMLSQFMAEMPDRYLLANTAEGVRFHAREGERKGRAPAVAAAPSGLGEGNLEVLVVTDDRPGLLADLAAALTANSFGIDSAQLYQRVRADGRREAFDLFHVNHPSGAGGAPLGKEVAALRRTIEALETGRLDAREVIARLPGRPTWARSGPRVKTEINVDNSASSRYTLVEVYTRDRAVLLYAIARALHDAGLSIAFAKVNTEGDRVADVFYVEDKGGGKLSADGQLSALSTSLRRTIRELDKKS